MPGSSSFDVGAIVCMSTRGLAGRWLDAPASAAGATVPQVPGAARVPHAGPSGVGRSAPASYGRRAGRHARRPVAPLHPSHRPHVVAAMAHVRHGQHRPRVERWHRRAQALRAPPAFRAAKPVRSIACAKIVNASCPLGSTIDVVGFGDGNAELIDRHRMHVLSVGGDHCDLQPGDAHVEVASSPTR